MASDRNPRWIFKNDKIQQKQGLLTVEKSFRSGSTGNRVFIFSVMVITGNLFFLK